MGTKTLLQTIFATTTVVILFVSSSVDAALVGQSFDISFNAIVDTGGFLPGIEAHTSAGQTFDGLGELLPINNLLGANGFDLEAQDAVTTIGPMSESVEVCIVNPNGGPIVNDPLNLGFPNFSILLLNNMNWGAGAGPAIVSNAQLSYVDGTGATVVVPTVPAFTGDGVAAPLGTVVIIPNDELADDMTSLCIRFDVAHPVPEPSSLWVLTLLMAPAMLFWRRRV